MVRFKKGSPAAKKYMARLRAKRKGITLSRRKMPRNDSSKRKRVSKTRRTRIKLKRRNIPMARKRKRVSRSRKGMFGALQKPLVAGITYAFVQPIVSQVLSRFNIGIQDELIQILGAVVIKSVVKGPIVDSWANAAIIINTASLVSGFTGNIFGALGATPSNSVNSGVVVVG